jgi:hypothetical protein
MELEIKADAIRTQIWQHMGVGKARRKAIADSKTITWAAIDMFSKLHQPMTQHNVSLLSPSLLLKYSRTRKIPPRTM